MLLVYYLQKNDEYVVLITLMMVVVMAESVLDVLFYAVDTIFICVLEDYERNDGTAARPYRMSDKLKTLIFIE